MLSLLQSSPSWAVVWHDAIVALITVSVTYIGLWVNRKRRSTQRAEDHKYDAEARRLEVESLADIYGQLKEARADIAQLVRAHAQETRELKDQHTKQVEFLRKQVDTKTDAEMEVHQEVKKVRARFHAAANEIQKCIFRVRDYEEMLRRCDPPAVFTPFDFTPYEELVRAWKTEDEAIMQDYPRITQ